MSAGSGPSSPAAFAYYDRDSRSWRTCQGSLFEEWATFSATWPSSGTTRDGFAYRPPTLEPDTFDDESSSSADGVDFPTPTASRYGSNRGGGMGRVGPTRYSLDTMAARGLWPTPIANDASGTRNATAKRNGSIGHPGTTLVDFVTMWPTPTASDGGNGPAGHREGGMNLRTAVTLWPTPTARDWKDRGDFTPRRIDETGPGPSLPSAVGGQLNPPWVEWLMGFPIGWTDCGRSVTPSCRRSRSTSPSGSSRSRGE